MSIDSCEVSISGCDVSHDASDFTSTEPAYEEYVETVVPNLSVQRSFSDQRPSHTDEAQTFLGGVIVVRDGAVSYSEHIDPKLPLCIPTVPKTAAARKINPVLYFDPTTGSLLIGSKLQDLSKLASYSFISGYKNQGYINSCLITGYKNDISYESDNSASGGTPTVPSGDMPIFSCIQCAQTSLTTTTLTQDGTTAIACKNIEAKNCPGAVFIGMNGGSAQPPLLQNISSTVVVPAIQVGLTPTTTITSDITTNNVFSSGDTHTQNVYGNNITAKGSITGSGITTSTGNINTLSSSSVTADTISSSAITTDTLTVTSQLVIPTGKIRYAVASSGPVTVQVTSDLAAVYAYPSKGRVWVYLDSTLPVGMTLTVTDATLIYNSKSRVREYNIVVSTQATDTAITPDSAAIEFYCLDPKMRAKVLTIGQGGYAVDTIGGSVTFRLVQPPGAGKVWMIENQFVGTRPTPAAQTQPASLSTMIQQTRM
jgi:hypothetical protein